LAAFRPALARKAGELIALEAWLAVMALHEAVSVSFSTYDSSCAKASGSTMAAGRVSEQAALPCPQIARCALASPGRTAAELAHARTIFLWRIQSRNELTHDTDISICL